MVPLFVLAESVQISDIPHQPYIVRSSETDAIPIISATTDFDPDTLNLDSEGKRVTAYIELPVGYGYSVSDIDLGSILLNGQVQAEARSWEIRSSLNPSTSGIHSRYGLTSRITYMRGKK